MSVIEGMEMALCFCAASNLILKEENSLWNCWGGIFQVDCNSQYPRLAEVRTSLETT